MQAQATTASTGARARNGRAVSNPNQLLEAILRQDWEAADAAPLRVWHQAQSIASGFDHAQHCAMRRGDKVAREAQLQLWQRWAIVQQVADWMDCQAEHSAAWQSAAWQSAA
jgi:hypothetical protein